MDYAVKPNMLNVPNNHFRKNEFETSIWKYGYPILLEKSVVCPCQTKDNSPLPNCQNCNGLGYTFINGIESRGLIINLNQSNKIKSWSAEMTGTSSLTLMQSHRISFMDRVTILDNPVIENNAVRSEVLTVRGNENKFIFLSYKPKSIYSIFVFNGSSNKLTVIPSDKYSISEDNPYVINFDFDFSTITDFNGSVSILYLHNLQYHIIDIPNIVRNSFKINASGSEEQLLLPTHAIIRLANNVLQIKDTDGLGLLNNDVDINLWE